MYSCIHLKGSGCQTCSWHITTTTSEFIEKAHKIEKHKDKYSYEKTVYGIKNTEKVIITCLIHGDFYQTPMEHLAGCGCPVCGKTIRKTLEQFIQDSIEVHGEKYDYKETIYINSTTKVRILCKKCDKFFFQTPTMHLNGNGCQRCAKNHIYSNQEFIERAIEIHRYRYNYEFVEYINTRTKVKIICQKHGMFHQTPNGHLFGAGCYVCKSSKGEVFVASLLKEFDKEFEQEYRFSVQGFNQYKFDFYLHNHNAVIEYHGMQHYHYVPFFHRNGISDFQRQQERDRIKENFCKDNNIPLLILPYTLSKDKIKEEIKIFLEQLSY